MSYEGLMTLYIVVSYLCIVGFVLGLINELDDFYHYELSAGGVFIICLFWFAWIPIFIFCLLGSFIVRKVWINGRRI
jgi:hypothetical protein